MDCWKDRRASVPQYGRAEVHADGHDLVGLVAPEHLFEQSAFLEVFTGDSEILQLFPVDHGLVVTVLGAGSAAGCQLRAACCWVSFFFAISS